ncbi:hypothetical protein MCOR25_010697 [Pyricularia grisea]|uniref:J domain-containing protein n=1 Tax=Pyricularia grisea TaxID=148305 RepID=A0A6P8BG77_PYRGI|nr:uncharacterized protein PgNI_00283 [Pyricularia grisea]KAI6349201.1 hypothetical protein MCOR25_010697 [Pyricularia grisea]TLD15710.1 hypothetical protein PgNI_00283 [Pyricularia grisea]
MTDAGRRSTHARRSGAFNDQDVTDLFNHYNQNNNNNSNNSNNNNNNLQPPARSLRSANSRYSLNEQFAATRREYEFGFDDSASSFMDLSIYGPQSQGHDVDGSEGAKELHVSRDHFELLCVPRHAPTREQVRRAYFRLFRLLDSESQPKQMRAVAAVYMADVQDAFETLVEDARRERYLEDLLVEENSQESDEADEIQTDTVAGPRQHSILPVPFPSSTDLGVRFVAEKGQTSSRQPGSAQKLPSVTPLDFCIGHSTSLPLPTLGRLLAIGVHRIQAAARSESLKVTDQEKPPEIAPILRTAPVLTLTAASYGLARDFTTVPPALLTDRYQPLLPEALPRHRMAQLLGNRPSPLVSLRLRQDLFLDKGVNNSGPSAVVELESEIFPQPALTGRFARTIQPPGHAQPLDLELMVSTTPTAFSPRPPRAGVGLSRRLGSGTGFLCADSGDFFWPSQVRAIDEATTCAGFPQFSKEHLNGKSLLSSIISPLLFLRTEPTVEVGYTSLAAGNLGLLGATGRPFLAPADRGIKGLDMETSKPSIRNRGSWAVSAAASSGQVAGYLRYGLDLVSALPKAVSSRLPFRPSAYHVEVELCTVRYLAIRALRRTSSRSSVGFEVGLSPVSLHLSLYWSRLAQRLRLPILLRSGSSSSSSSSNNSAASRTAVLWAVAIPMFALAALDLVRKKPQRRSVNAAAADSVARRRAEADELTAVLATGTQARQTAERIRGGLVILAAKYGVPGSTYSGMTVFNSEFEVADVTIAVAALVVGADQEDGAGSLYIPQGLRKSRLVGFWDPAPGQTKVLQVKYVYCGKEGIVEVRGRDELRLPPVVFDEKGSTR